jgi:hypothetical protein
LNLPADQKLDLLHGIGDVLHGMRSSASGGILNNAENPQ